MYFRVKQYLMFLWGYKRSRPTQFKKKKCKQTKSSPEVLGGDVAEGSSYGKQEREFEVIECYYVGEVRAPYWENPISGQWDLIAMYEIIKNLSESLYSALLRVILPSWVDRGGNTAACVRICTQMHTGDK